MAICHIIGAGDAAALPSQKEGDLIIAADGGYDALKDRGITPNLLIGDLDSIRCVPSGTEIIRYPEKKDETDMHLAYLEGRRRGYSEFLIYGGTGGRSDHTYANYCLLHYIAKDGGRATLIDEFSTARVICDGESVQLFSECGTHFSVFAIGGEASGVNILGGEYSAEGISLTPEFPLGVSNRFSGSAVTVSVSRGALLIITDVR